MHLRSLIPPVMWRLWPQPAMPEYASYDEALADSDTYEDPAVIDIVSSKTKAYVARIASQRSPAVSSRQTLQNMFVLSHVSEGRPVGVLEVGGACGALAVELNHSLPGHISRWHIVETPAMVAAGRQTLHEGPVAFYESLDVAAHALARRDLLIAQGVLQYTRDPHGALQSWLRLGFEFLYITRTAISEDLKTPVITKQTTRLRDHGPGDAMDNCADGATSQPLTILPADDILQEIGESYRTLFAFVEGGSRSLKIGGRAVKVSFTGQLVRRRT